MPQAGRIPVRIRLSVQIGQTVSHFAAIGTESDKYRMLMRVGELDDSGLVLRWDVVVLSDEPPGGQEVVVL